MVQRARTLVVQPAETAEMFMMSCVGSLECMNWTFWQFYKCRLQYAGSSNAFYRDVYPSFTKGPVDLGKCVSHINHWPIDTRKSCMTPHWLAEVKQACCHGIAEMAVALCMVLAAPLHFGFATCKLKTLICVFCFFSSSLCFCNTNRFYPLV